MTDRLKDALELIELAQRLAPEAEGIDLSDRDYTMQDIAEIRSLMTSMRSAIDTVHTALAKKWRLEYGYETYDDGANIWSTGRTKGKKVVDPEALFAWLATKDADELAKLVPGYSLKVGGMTEAERSTFLDESPANDKLSVKSKPKGV